MLVLTRKTQQQIQFGSDIVITILQVKGQTVRVGIEAPRGVRVVRGEIASKPRRDETPLATEPAVAEAAVAESQMPEAGHAMATSRAASHPAPPDAAPAATGSRAERFSSPASPQPRLFGESSGLFPRLRRRAENAFKADGTMRRGPRAAPLTLRSLADSRL